MNSYRFGPFVLDPGERRLLREGQPVALTPKAFDILVYLVERHGHLVSKDDLMEAMWGGSHVEEGSLARTIHVLRKALTTADADPQLHPQFIETVPTKGYRFVAAVQRVADCSSSPGEAVAAEEPDRRQQAQPRSWRRAIFAASTLMVLALSGSAWRALVSTAPAGARPLTRPTRSGAAYARFQSGRLLLERHYRGDIERSLEDFQAAIQLDPAFADAYAGKADGKFFRYANTGAHDDIVQARLAVGKALDLNARSSYAHALQCRLLGTYDWDLAAAETECRRAVELDPLNHEARKEWAFLLTALGRRDDGLKEMDAAIALAPTSFNKRSRGLLLYFHRRFDEAILQLKQVEATDPGYVESRRWISRCFEQKKEYDQALDFLILFRESDGARPEEIATIRRAFATAGWQAALRASLPDGRPVATLEAAGTLAQLSNIDGAFEVLEMMIRARRPMIIHMDGEPRLDPLRSDPRFEDVARRVGLRQPRVDDPPAVQ